MAKATKKQYDVFLNPADCLSYTLPNGKLIPSGRSSVVGEDEIEMYRSAGCFTIGLRTGVNEHPERESDSAPESVTEIKTAEIKERVVKKT